MRLGPSAWTRTASWTARPTPLRDRAEKRHVGRPRRSPPSGRQCAARIRRSPDRHGSAPQTRGARHAVRCEDTPRPVKPPCFSSIGSAIDAGRRTRAHVHAPDQRRVKFTTGRTSPRYAAGSPFGNRQLSSQADINFAAATGPVCLPQSDAPSGGSTRSEISGLAANRSDRCPCRETPAASTTPANATGRLGKASRRKSANATEKPAPPRRHTGRSSDYSCLPSTSIQYYRNTGTAVAIG